MKSYSILILISLFVIFSSCRLSSPSATSTVVDISEPAQQIGDNMASMDESGGSASGTYAYNWDSEIKTFARLDKLNRTEANPVVFNLFSKAHAVYCSDSSTFSSCSSNVITRTFGGCTLYAGVTISGTVTLNFTDAAVDSTCSLASTGHLVTRNPNFTITGRRGATLTVSKTGTYGQRVTRTASGFTFENDGIRRTFSGGTTTFDFKTETTTALTFTGTTRANRTLTAGTLRVTNMSTNVTCDFSPATSITWTTGCNCATSGTWSMSCSDGITGSMVINSCGNATLTQGSDSETFTFDRCSSL